MTTMNDIMVDLETTGSCPGCGILSIGAVAFDPHTDAMDDGFYAVVNTKDCEELFLTASQDTMDWWRKQSPEAREVLELAADPNRSHSVVGALGMLNNYLARFGSSTKIRVWGNGSDFDNAILAVAYEAAQVKPYWKFWNNRCHRTIKNLAKGVTLEREGTYHNALDDAKTQALHMQKIMAASNRGDIRLGHN